jgi:hypothetical protein
VTPKRGAAGRQPRAVLPGIAAITALVATAVYGLLRSRDPGTLNNAAFALVHVSVLAAGVGPALRGAEAAGDETDAGPAAGPGEEQAVAGARRAA